MSDSISTLLVDDNPDDRALVIRELRRDLPKFKPLEVSDEASFAQVLQSSHFDLVITDFQLRWTDGLNVLRRVKSRWPDCPVVMFTGTGSEEIAVEAMKAGLDDYVLKSARHYSRLPSVARRALKMARQRQQLKQAEARYAFLFNTVPVGLYRAASDGRLLDANPALAQMLGYPDASSLLALSLPQLYWNAADYTEWEGQVQNRGVVHSFETQLRAADGSPCWVETSARAIREPQTQQLIYEGSVEDIRHRKAADDERERLILELQDALARIQTLSGLLPICAACKKIRDDKGYWNQIEVYIQEHSDAEFTHSFCPECVRKLYPEVFTEEANTTP